MIKLNSNEQNMNKTKNTIPKKSSIPPCPSANRIKGSDVKIIKSRNFLSLSSLVNWLPIFITLLFIPIIQPTGY